MCVCVRMYLKFHNFKTIKEDVGCVCEREKIYSFSSSCALITVKSSLTVLFLLKQSAFYLFIGLHTHTHTSIHNQIHTHPDTADTQTHRHTHTYPDTEDTQTHRHTHTHTQAHTTTAETHTLPH